MIYPHEIKVICCDVDGTLVTDEKKIMPEVKRWVQVAVNRKNVKFVIVSGRMLSGIRHYYDELGITGPVSAFNGNALYDEEDRLVADHRVSGKIARRVIDASRRVSIPLIFFDNCTWYMEKYDEYTINHKTPIYLSDCVFSDFDILCEKKLSNKFLAMTPDNNLIDRFVSELEKEGIDCNTVNFYRGKDFIEIMGRDFTKGNAVDDVSRFFNVPCENIMAIGDDYNDVPMLERAGLAVAMGNAVDEAKKVSDFITSTNEDGGVAKAIERFVFGVYNE